MTIWHDLDWFGHIFAIRWNDRHPRNCFQDTAMDYLDFEWFRSFPLLSVLQAFLVCHTVCTCVHVPLLPVTSSFLSHPGGHTKYHFPRHEPQEASRSLKEPQVLTEILIILGPLCNNMQHRSVVNTFVHRVERRHPSANNILGVKWCYPLRADHFRADAMSQISMRVDEGSRWNSSRRIISQQCL